MTDSTSFDCWPRGVRPRRAVPATAPHRVRRSEMPRRRLWLLARARTAGQKRAPWPLGRARVGSVDSPPLQDRVRNRPGGKLAPRRCTSSRNDVRQSLAGEISKRAGDGSSPQGSCNSNRWMGRGSHLETRIGDSCRRTRKRCNFGCHRRPRGI